MRMRSPTASLLAAVLLLHWTCFVPGPVCPKIVQESASKQVDNKQISECRINDNACSLKDEEEEETDSITNIDIADKGDDNEELGCNVPMEGEKAKKISKQTITEQAGLTVGTLGKLQLSDSNSVRKWLQGMQADIDKLMRSVEDVPGQPSNKDDEHSEFSKKILGNVAREKEQVEEDWKQAAASTLKKQALRVSNHARQWWGGMQPKMDKQAEILGEKWKPTISKQLVSTGETLKKQGLRVLITARRFWKYIEAEMEKQMEEDLTGAPNMKMHTREESLIHVMEDADAHDVDDQDQKQSNLPVNMGEKEKSEEGWKQTGETSKKHAVSETLKKRTVRVLNGVRQWLQGTKAEPGT